jgi:glycine/D-amino acid oxidase-like deaminating enzyme
MEVRAGGVRDQTGAWHQGDRVVICTGASQEGVAAEALAGAAVRRCRLQMMETVPHHRPVTTSVADGDSLRYYPAYDVPARAELPAQDELSAAGRMQLLLVQRLDGGLTIGDTHEYDEPFDFAVRDDLAAELTRRAGLALGGEPPAVARRWTGVYSETTDGSLYLRRQLCDNVTLVTAPGGRGMTMSAAIAEETLG